MVVVLVALVVTVVMVVVLLVVVLPCPPSLPALPAALLSIVFHVLPLSSFHFLSLVLFPSSHPHPIPFRPSSPTQ